MDALRKRVFGTLVSNIYFTWLHRAARVWLALPLALLAVVVPATLLRAQLPTPTPSLPATTQEPTSLLTEEQSDADLDASPPILGILF